jgi:hypothetical protein
MFKKILVANRGTHAAGMAQQIARAMSRGSDYV